MDPSGLGLGDGGQWALARGVSAWHDSEVCKWHRDSAKTTREQDVEAQASRRRAADGELSTGPFPLQYYYYSIDLHFHTFPARAAPLSDTEPRLKGRTLYPGGIPQARSGQVYYSAKI
jgi:hypothetical protein